MLTASVANDRHLLQRSAVIIAMAAWENKNSVGCHFRED
jgi:aspartate oxidase